MRSEGGIWLGIWLLVLLWGTLTEAIWHAYNGTKHKSANRANCPDFKTATRPLSEEEIAAKKLWPGLTKEYDRTHGESIYGFRMGLAEIWRNQFPANCSEAKFLVSGGWPYGFGSRIHVEGWGLAIAMQLGRVYLSHPDGDNIFWETNNPHCKAQKQIGLECYYQPVSNCTILDAIDALHRDVNAFKITHPSDFNTIFDNPEHLATVKQALAGQRALNILYTVGGGAYTATRFIPSSVKPVIACSPMQEDVHYYWWRAISATFLLRPNQPTLDLMAMYRNKLPLSDAEQCIAMFVRHGDKGIEMKLIEFTTYAETAKMLWNQGYLPLHARTEQGSSHIESLNFSHSSAFAYSPENAAKNPVQNCTIFVTTEDPLVIKESDEWGSKNGCRIMYTTVYDRAKSIMQFDWNTQHKHGVPLGHHDFEYLSMMLNLEYAARCEAWVCTIASNSCRVMDELRATLGAKANRFFADLSLETCRRPPCIGTEDAEIYSFGD